MRPVRFLLLEDDPLDVELIEAALRREMPESVLTRVADRTAYRAALSSNQHDLVLADYSLPHFDGMEALTIARELAPDLPFIFVSGMLGEEIALETLREGATDYVLKHRLNRLPNVVLRALAESRERSERRRAEAQQALLVAELSHRVKNTLATVLALAQQTMRNATTLDDFEKRFTARVLALSEAHTLLARSHWGATELPELAQRILAGVAATQPAQFVLEGEVVKLPPRVALSLGLVLHELAANAAEHGAWTSPQGRVRVLWSAHDDRLDLTWEERDGPSLTGAGQHGFGLRLIQRTLKHELGGEAGFTFESVGFSCHMTLRLTTEDEHASA